MSIKDGQSSKEKDEEKAVDKNDVHVAELVPLPGLAGFIRKVSALGVEVRGSSPVPLDERTNRRTFNLFTLWFTMSVNLVT